MFRKIVGFELRYQLTSPVFWVAFAIFFLLTYGSTVVPNIQIGSSGAVFVNSPFAIIQKTAIMSIFAMFIVTAFVANVVVRDDETGFGPIVRTTRVTKFDYLIGRFTGAFLAGMVAMASVPLAIMFGSLMPWLDPMKVGPFVLNHYLYAYFLIALPSVLITSVTFFAVATATRSMLASYLGVVAFLILYVTFLSLFRKPEFDHIVALWEPFGIGAIGEVTKYWTVNDRNSTLPPIIGLVLYNRLIWATISLAVLALAYGVFHVETKATRGGKAKKAKAEAAAPAPTVQPQPRFDGKTAFAQFRKWTRFEMAQVFKSPAFFVLVLLGLFNGGGAMIFADENNGYTIFPVTITMIEALRGAFTIIPLIIAIYYAGELVWRERERRTHEIFGACPVSDWTFVLPKIAAISLVLFSTYAISIIAAIAIQTFKGYTDYHLNQYIAWYLLPDGMVAIEYAALAIFVQTLSPHKYIGWAVMGLYLVATITFATMGLEDNLYIYASTSNVPLSDMNGQGKFWIGAWWFLSYWGAVALLLAVLSFALWRRGAETRLMPRLARLPYRLRGVAGGIAAVAVIASAGMGGYIFYNTHILNDYKTSIDNEKFSAEYEKALLKYEHVPQPRITSVSLKVGVYPHDPKVETTGIYTIQNRTGKPLGAMHIRWNDALKMKSLTVEGAKLSENFAKFSYQIWKFTTPMQPNEVRKVHFTTVLEQKGFKNNGNMSRVVDNGTFVNNMEITPSIGMDRSGGLLTDPVKRRRYHLPSQLRPAKLEDDRARANNYLRHDSDWVTSDITVSTVADQTPIAPGYKTSETVKDGRKTVHFVSDSPIANFFSIQSADYAVRHEKWKNVDLAVYYDKQHPFNIDRMLRAMKASLAEFSTDFSPYQFHQARIIEFPKYESFAQSFANTIPYSENLGFIQNYDAIKDNPDKFDMVTFVTAHELGHQWWAHQVIGADMQGMTMLSETFAQYSAMLVMEKMYGPEKMRTFLKFWLDRYLRARGGEEVEELPLYRAENQAYIHYGKGAVVMYRLKETVGEDVVNRSLRKLLAAYAFKPAPYPKTSDFLAILRQEAGPKYNALITDLFEKITVYDLKATEASAKKRADGKYDLTLEVEAHKFYANGKGKETEAQMQEEVPVGAFLAEPGKKDFDKSKIISFTRLPVKSGKQSLHLVVAKLPAFAGVAPYKDYIDRNADDNVVKVTVQ
ncbi:aminopeptidase N [Rhizomicrobium palustre]|uniref:Aminopeptidase N n=1 Tax=Rhizomicrobium palustre TaxID=189966 RepID=A0A846N0W4_9PROT|nr:M1 family aminopeptidase [Rhizomicrobium palustre]NIK89129.1 aminopeptidase N [Rhizomicrobium palustre]